MIDIPTFGTNDELFKFLKDNLHDLKAQKKAEIKHADAICYHESTATKNAGVTKANVEFTPSGDEIKVKVVINTTNLMDSHNDVHFPNMWNKSLNENKDIMHLQEHRMKFDHIISSGSNLKAYVKEFSFSELGFNYEGNTQALIFESTIKKERNSFMFDQYSKGYVTQHSVGMRYVKIVLCVNSEKEYYGAEKEAWDKYFPQVANKELAEKRGYFWAVTEAKVIEGSAVPLGSNHATPTLDNNLKNEPLQNTQQKDNEPSLDTQNKLKEFYLNS
jgi:hypothetical protein